MTFRQAKEFLEKHTKVVQLTDGQNASVLVCPEYQGRVMTSTCAGDAGPSLGWIHREYIEQRRSDKHFNNYGGEDRLWLSPEGGPFSLWFAPGAKQELANWYTPAGLNDGAFEVAAGADPNVCRMHRSMKLTNTAGAKFNFEIERDVRLLGPEEFGKFIAATGSAAAAGASRATPI